MTTQDECPDEAARDLNDTAHQPTPSDSGNSQYWTEERRRQALPKEAVPPEDPREDPPPEDPRDKSGGHQPGKKPSGDLDQDPGEEPGKNARDPGP